MASLPVIKIKSNNFLQNTSIKFLILIIHNWSQLQHKPIVIKRAINVDDDFFFKSYKAWKSGALIMTCIIVWTSWWYFEGGFCWVGVGLVFVRPFLRKSDLQRRHLNSKYP